MNILEVCKSLLAEYMAASIARIPVDCTKKKMECFGAIVNTEYGSQVFEHYNLEIWGMDTDDKRAEDERALLIQREDGKEVIKTLNSWIALYHKERRDKLALVAGIDPEDFDAPTARVNRPKM